MLPSKQMNGPLEYSSVLTSLDITYDQSELRQLENSRGKERLYIG